MVLLCVDYGDSNQFTVLVSKDVVTCIPSMVSFLDRAFNIIDVEHIY